MGLEVKKEKAKKGCLFLRINCSRQYWRDLFRDWNASSKDGAAKLFREFKAPRRYGWCFWRLSDIVKATKHDFTLKEGKFNWCVQRSKNKKEKWLSYLHVKLQQKNTRDVFIKGWNN